MSVLASAFLSDFFLEFLDIKLHAVMLTINVIRDDIASLFFFFSLMEET
jgi:hypothetical protein